MFDEELSAGDIEFSDDEVEREYKQKRKQKKAINRLQKSGDLEEGEVPANLIGKKRRNNKQ
jgi:hypothetical protein